MDKTPLHGWRRAATLLGILVICAGTTTSNRSCSLAGSGSNSGDGGDDPTFVATLQLQDTQGNVTASFQRQELIQMILTVRNRRDTTETIDFTNSRTSDFVVVRANYYPAWTAHTDEGPVALFAREGQLAFTAPKGGSYVVRLQYPARRRLSVFAIVAFLAGAVVLTWIRT